MLTKQVFLQDPFIQEYVEVLAALVRGDNFHHRYKIEHKAWRKAHGQSGIWSCDSLPEAAKQYWWFGSLEDNDRQLRELSCSLRAAIDQNNLDACFFEAIRILDWGQVYKGAVNYLVTQRQKGTLITNIIRATDILLAEDDHGLGEFKTDLRMDSGMTKIYSLANSNSIIYDDRVGTALSFIAKRTFSSQDTQTHANAIKRMVFFGHGDKAKQKIQDGFSTRVTRDKHARLNLISNWLIDEAVQKAISLGLDWSLWGIDVNSPDPHLSYACELKRKLEAALFMVGSDVIGF